MLTSGWGGLATVVGVSTAWQASAHTAEVPLPQQRDYQVRWYQPHGVRPVDDWEIEVTPVRNPTQRFIASAQVEPEFSCWALDVPIAEPAVVKIRSVVGTQVSAWSRPTTVPEPALVTSVATACGMLSLLARRGRKGPSRVA